MEPIEVELLKREDLWVWLYGRGFYFAKEK